MEVREDGVYMADTYSMTKFMDTAISVLGWGELANEIVMDVGCGIGLNSTKFLLEKFPKIRDVVAIDQASDLIRMAISQNLNIKISYYTADIAEESTLSPWQGMISKIVCVDCLVWLRDQRIAFVNMFNLLNPGGSAAIMTGTSSPFMETLEYLITKTKWRHSNLGTEATFPIFPEKKPQLKDYFKILPEIGFLLLHCDQFYRIFDYPSMMDVIAKGTEFISPFLIHIPEDQRTEFRNDFFQAFSTVHGLTPDGGCCVRVRTVNLFVKKPFTK